MFSWITAYEQITERLLKYENRQKELIVILQSIGITNFSDQDANGNSIPLSEIDPLTFLCYLNKYGDEKRLLFLRTLCEKWNITPLPEDVKGIPNVNAQRVWLFQFKRDRQNNEIQRLWNFYKALMNNTIDNTIFENVLEIRGVGKPKLTEGMFIVKPNEFLCLNGVVKPFLQAKNISFDFDSYEEYIKRINLAKLQLNKSFPEISYEAYLKAIGEDEPNDVLSVVNDGGEKSTKYKKIVMANTLNTILYGPPGTGKTYHSINKSVAIASPEFIIAKSSREQIKNEYERLVKDGQIEFITFHQSMSYEDFIEGIKPVDPNETGDFLKYEIKDGIFKRLCERAIRVPEIKASSFTITEEEFQNSNFYKMSLGDTSNPDDDQIYDWCIKNGYIALGRGDVIDFSGMKENDIQQMVPDKLDKFSSQSINYFIHYAKRDDYVIVTYGNLQFRAIGKIIGDYEFKKVDGLHVHQFRKVQWLWHGKELPYEEIYDRQFQQQSIYKMDKRGIKKDFLMKGGNTVSTVDSKPKNYVLIIDEINRGNVSQIFGELITLIEDDKRAGKNEALTVTLPYSKKSFSVPSNLYIIGTMNTADRSVEALDTALRRRFAFEFMDSQPQILSSYHLLHRLWFKHWLAEPGTKEWEAWVADEQNFIELSGMSKEEVRYKALADKYEKEGMEAQWLESKPAELFAGIVQFNGGVDLSQLLKAVNERLEVLLSKDHTIGHAWLMSVFSVEDLKEVFRNKIIPLLQEFFYKDYAKIGLVLGSAFVKPRKVERKIFANFKDENELAAEYEDTIIYTLSDTNDLQLNDFISIYK